MAHPDLVALALLPESVEQHRIPDDLDEGAAELAIVGGRDPAAQLLGHRLLAVADAEDRHAGLEEMLRRARAVRPHHRGRAAGEDDPLRPQPREGLVGAVERRDLAIDPASRTRRAMSWVTWLPKSTMRTESGCMAGR
jgi:hypothetical protein